MAETPTALEATGPAAERRVFGWTAAPWVLYAVTFGLALLRLLYLAQLSPFTLTEDEAHYWDWSRSLDWSYYSKGPGVAWTIAASTSLFGDTEFGVRAPATVFCAIGAFAVGLLAQNIFRDRRMAVLAALAYQSMPGTIVTALLMTIDGPYLACWAIACLAGWLALGRGSRLAWPALGLALSAGFLFKYTMALLIPGLILFVIIRRRSLRVAGPLWVVLGVVFALLGFVPIVLWNADHDWATARHLLGHLGVAGGDVARNRKPGWDYEPMWTLEYLLLCFAVAGGVFLLAMQALRNFRIASRERPGQWAQAGPVFLYCCAAPVAILYFLVTFFTRVEANWALASFISLAPVCAWAAVDGFSRNDGGVKFVWNLAMYTLVLLTAAPVIVGFGGRVFEGVGIPTMRVSGARDLATQAAAEAEVLREQTGLEPFYMTVHYGRASLLSFYLPGHPRVYAVSSHMGDGRRSQFDVWEDTDVTRAEVNERLRGRPAVLFGGWNADWRIAFDEVEDIGALPAEPKEDRSTWHGSGYHGFPGHSP